jgi:gluconate:H+ symporter, GntP family
MPGSFYQQLFILLLAIILIVFLTSRLRIHPFFALIAVSALTGVLSGLPAEALINVMKDGFANIMKSLAFMIVFGITLGILLERSGSTAVLATFILKKVGIKNSALAMSITGFISGLPIFCDSGFIVLSGLNLSVAAKAGISVIIPAVALATGLYSVHCLIPPHPGATAAAGILGVGMGKLILIGILTALPAMFAGYLWAVFAGRKFGDDKEAAHETYIAPEHQPSVVLSVLPVVIPIFLIAARAYVAKAPVTFLSSFINIAGEPVIALFIGVILTLFNFRSVNRKSLESVLHESVERSGNILLIIGAGASFGAVLGAMNIGGNFSHVLPLEKLGILFPFILAALLKTAQGSSTVAIITTASIIEPLLPALGLESENGRLLAVLSMGAGSMILSHANDSYFWVILNFQKLTMQPMLKVYSVATLGMGVVSLLMVYVWSLLLM